MSKASFLERLLPCFPWPDSSPVPFTTDTRQLQVQALLSSPVPDTTDTRQLQVQALLSSPVPDTTDNRQLQVQALLEMWKGLDILDYGRKIELLQAKEQPVLWWRQRILLETLDALRTRALRAEKLAQAMSNVERWKHTANPPSKSKAAVSVIEGDWGEVTLKLTMQYGAIFAVLNMAHAVCPGGGGGYVNGTVAQEENMFRRTDCHFGMDRQTMEITSRPVMNVVAGDYLYTQSETELINGQGGLVHLDKESPRVCFRGKEENDKQLQGYKIMPDSEWFPFYELRSAAVDLREDTKGNKRTDEEKQLAFIELDIEGELRKRIVAQMDTLRHGSVRHVVLSAFGCGAFGNPAASVAKVYAEVIQEYASDFDVIAFAIFYAGYGARDNFDAFNSVMQNV